MAILSAHSRRSPTTTAESSPTLERQMDSFESSEDGANLDHVTVDEDIREKSAEEDSSETQCRSLSSGTCVTEINMQIRAIPMEENPILGLDSQERVDTDNEEIRKSNAELISERDAPRNATVHLEILLSRKNKEGEKELEKSSENRCVITSKPQMTRRVFRGDSRDSGIGDCSSTCQASASLQMDELGVVSIIEEEMDHETHHRESEWVSRREDISKDQRSTTSTGILASLGQNRDVPLDETGSRQGSEGKVAIKNGVTKTACDEINPVPKGVCLMRVQSSILLRVVYYMIIPNILTFSQLPTRIRTQGY